jgi:DNA-binding CsgD family transcriptional regulator
MPPKASQPKPFVSTQMLSPREAQALRRERDAIELRMAGATYEDIGEMLGMNKAGAQKAVKRAMEKLKQEIIEGGDTLKAIEIARLDRMQEGIWKLATGKFPDVKAIDMILKIMDRRAKLLGLDVVTETTEPRKTIVRVIHVNEAGEDITGEIRDPLDNNITMQNNQEYDDRG